MFKLLVLKSALCPVSGSKCFHTPVTHQLPMYEMNVKALSYSCHPFLSCVWVKGESTFNSFILCHPSPSCVWVKDERTFILLLPLSYTSPSCVWIKGERTFILLLPLSYTFPSCVWVKGESTFILCHPSPSYVCVKGERTFILCHSSLTPLLPVSGSNVRELSYSCHPFPSCV